MRTDSLLSSLHSRLESSLSSTMIRKMNRHRYVYRVHLDDRCACCSRYDVMERNALNGEGASLEGAGKDARLKQNTLFALTKSYTASNTPISGPGNAAKSDLVSSGFGVGVVGRDPGARTPSPIVLRVEPMDQASGTSSWMAT